MKALLAGVVALAILVFTPPRAQELRGTTDERPPTLEDGWKTATAESLGLNSNRLAALTQSIRAWPELGVHAILIERAGRLGYEQYFDGFDERLGQPLGRMTMSRNTLHDVRSISKSVVSALVGIALAAGTIQSLDQPIVEWFPEYPELNTDERRRVTFRYAMTMTSGLEWNENVPYTDPSNDAIKMTRESEPLRYALSRPLATASGTKFNYNGGLVELVAAALERATKTTLPEYARTKLFAPLGIISFEWIGSLAEKPEAASGLRLRPRDLAKLASLYLHHGQWNGKQVVPADWVALSTRRQFRFPQPIGADAGGEFGYGLLWWYFCYPTSAGLIEVRTAFGNGQQWIFVLPGLDMAVTILAGRYNDVTSGATLGTRILREHVIPAVKHGIEPGCPGS
jgi:CubicO group peptidase (beta-lactamase class C family)